MKNNKKLLGMLLALIIFIQLAVPTGAVLYAKRTGHNLAAAPTYKFRISNLYYGNNGEGWVDFMINDINRYGKKYAVVNTDDNGFARLDFTSDKPNGSNYIKNEGHSLNFYVDLYKEGSCLNDIPVFERIDSVSFTSDSGQLSVDPDGYMVVGTDEMYLEAKVYNGSILPQRIIVDGGNLYDVLSFYSNNFDAIYDKYLNG